MPERIRRVFIHQTISVMYHCLRASVLLLAIIFQGCAREYRSGQPEEERHQEGPPIQLTYFSERAEFFIEHDPLEEGKESAILIHLTDLSTYKPFIYGRVSVHMNGEPAVSGELQRPGIFKASFTPPHAGEYSVVYRFQADSLSESVKGQFHVSGRNNENQGGGNVHMDHSGGADREGEISFLKEQAWSSNFMVSEIGKVPFSAVIRTSGEILPVPGKKKSIASTCSGIVVFADNKLVQGSPVTRGQLLFTVTSETLVENNMQLMYRESLNNYQKSRSEFERHAKLFSQGVISERQFISTRSDFIRDSLQYASLAAGTLGDGMKIFSPVSGTIHELNVSEGSFVEPGLILATISSNQSLIIRADLSQQFFSHLSEIESANFRPAYSDRIYSVEEMNGELLAAGASVAENDHYLPVIFEVENDGSLLEGAYTEVFLKASLRHGVIAVPLSAVSEEQGRYYTYVQVTGESYIKRAVSLGDSDGRYVEIRDGLEPGEHIVTEGVTLVKAASLGSGSGVQPHIH
jgi:cobalt-zinc-cadmium efflux system membrane fusion protein